MQNYESLKVLLQQASIRDEEWSLFKKRTVLKKVQKGDYLIRAGEIVEYAYFCVAGIFRMYYILENGKEYNKSFSLANDFVTSYGSMIKQELSHFSVQALEDSVVIEVPYKLLIELMEESHAWERFVRKCVEKLYLKKEERERQLLYHDAMERYKAFLKEYPGLASKIPQYHVASYLGISPVSLSRLMSSTKN